MQYARYAVSVLGRALESLGMERIRSAVPCYPVQYGGARRVTAARRRWRGGPSTRDQTPPAPRRPQDGGQYRRPENKRNDLLYFATDRPK